MLFILGEKGEQKQNKSVWIYQQKWDKDPCRGARSVVVGGGQAQDMKHMLYRGKGVKEGLCREGRSQGHRENHWAWQMMKTWGGRKDEDAKKR